MPHTYAVTSGSLPTGLSVNNSTGVISGTPTVVGSSSFTITVTDSLRWVREHSRIVVSAVSSDNGAFAKCEDLETYVFQAEPAVKPVR